MKKLLSFLKILSLAFAVVLTVFWSEVPAMADEHGGGTMKEHGGAAVPSAAKNALDGKMFAAEIGEKGKTKGDQDEITFKDGKFHSSACDKYGYGDGAYSATTQGNTVIFTAETTSPKDGKMSWNGKAAGAEIQGSAIHTKQNGATSEMWFKGNLKK